MAKSFQDMTRDEIKEIVMGYLEDDSLSLPDGWDVECYECPDGCCGSCDLVVDGVYQITFYPYPFPKDPNG
jgi:hypothetical protein